MPELWDLFDADRRPLGRLHKRGRPLPEGCYHLVVHIWLYNARGELLLSRRDPCKPFGLLWECTGGSVVAGEDSPTGALREVEEEVGLTLPSSALWFWRGERRESDFLDQYLAHTEAALDALTFQPGEVIDAQWADEDAVRRLWEAGALVPMLGFFPEVFEAVRARLTTC